MRVGAALENTQLYDAERAARQVAERTARRLDALQRLFQLPSHHVLRSTDSSASTSRASS